MAAITERLARREILILDGGTGTELERRGVPMHDVAWCGPAILEHRDVLEEVHADYVRAGSDVIITNTFATARSLLQAAGLGHKVREVNAGAVEAAKVARARAAHGREVYVAGSISPMAPGADPKRRLPIDRAEADYREQAEILAEAGVDLIALEMMRDVDYTRAAIRAAVATGLPVWVGFSCRSAGAEVVMTPGIAEHLALADVVAPAMAAGGSLLAIMHTDVEDTVPALEIARRQWRGPLGAYPHSGISRCRTGSSTP